MGHNQKLFANIYMVSTHLNERLDRTPTLKLLLTHTPSHFTRVTLYTGNDGMWVGPVFGSIIVLLNNDDLFTRLTALEDNGNL